MLTCGRMVAHGLRGQKGNILFPFPGYYHYYGGGGYVFLVVTANSVNIHDKLFRMRNGIVDMKGDISR